MFHKCDDTACLTRYALKGRLVLVGCAWLKKRDLAFSLNGGQRIVQLVRGVADKLFLTLIGLIDLIDDTTRVEFTNPVDE